MRKYLASFDIEIAKIIPEGEDDWSRHRPLGVTCAAAMSSDGSQWLWYSQDNEGKFNPQMSGEQLRQMLNVLCRLVDDDRSLAAQKVLWLGKRVNLCLNHMR